MALRKGRFSAVEQLGALLAKRNHNMIKTAKLNARPIVLDEKKLAEITPSDIGTMPTWKIDLKCEADGAFLIELSALVKKHTNPQP
jgi:hypothetical protein